MASKKITELDALVAPASTDVVAVVDLSGTPTTKKSTLAQLASALTLTLSQITGLVTALAATVANTRSVISGAGLTGGGDLSSDRTLAVGAGPGITVNADDIALTDMATKTYKGRTTAGTGAPEDVAVATVKADLVLVKGDVGLGNVDNTSDAGKPVSTAQQTALDLKANLASPALTGTPTAPTQTPNDNSTKIATTAYVENAVLSQNFKEACKYGSTAALPALVYDNGSSGVGATLTAVGFGALSFDGSTPSIGDRVLIKNQASTLQNGIYTVTIVGGVATLFILTRATDFNQSTDILTGDSCFITTGTTQSATTWAYTGIDAPTMGSTALTFVQTAGQGALSSGLGITITGNSVAVTPHALLDGSIDSDTLAGSATRGDIIVGNATPKWARVAKGAAGAVLRSDGTDIAWANVALRSSFNGLEMRTNPDAVLALSQLTLMRAANMVFDDGVSVATSAELNLTADITASGAGGLDTGTEGSSRWYEIYCIRKSSDGTRNLLLHRAKDWTVDPSFTTVRDASRALRRATGTATDKLAQGVKFATSMPFVFADVEVVQAGAPTGNVWFTLESDTAGSPSGSVLATSDKVDVTTIAAAGSNQIIRVHFRTPYTVTATTQYHLVLQGDYTRSDTVNVAWRGVAAGGYADGSAKEYNGTSWSAASGVGDFYFKAYTEQNDTAITYPAGYDEKCLIGYVYNRSTGHFLPFWQHDHTVMTPAVYYVSLTGVTIETLASTFTGIPPAPSVGIYLLDNDAAGTSTINGTLTTNTIDLGGFYSRTTRVMWGYEVTHEKQGIYFTVTSGGVTTDFYSIGFKW